MLRIDKSGKAAILYRRCTPEAAKIWFSNPSGRFALLNQILADSGAAQLCLRQS
jgi:hypothetical protein